ncbi:hypothetical protein C8F01DRAFT_1086546 [Mycena amicta]|nr:hypothetical protein C8F01DRAFT_1086546 [Mycena amicta]
MAVCEPLFRFPVTRSAGFAGTSSHPTAAPLVPVRDHENGPGSATLSLNANCCWHWAPSSSALCRLGVTANLFQADFSAAASRRLFSRVEFIRLFSSLGCSPSQKKCQVHPSTHVIAQSFVDQTHSDSTLLRPPPPFLHELATLFRGLTPPPSTPLPPSIWTRRQYPLGRHRRAHTPGTCTGLRLVKKKLVKSRIQGPATATSTRKRQELLPSKHTRRLKTSARRPNEDKTIDYSGSAPFATQHTQSSHHLTLVARSPPLSSKAQAEGCVFHAGRVPLLDYRQHCPERAPHLGVLNPLPAASTHTLQMASRASSFISPLARVHSSGTLGLIGGRQRDDRRQWWYRRWVEHCVLGGDDEKIDIGTYGMQCG